MHIDGRKVAMLACWLMAASAVLALGACGGGAVDEGAAPGSVTGALSNFESSFSMPDPGWPRPSPPATWWSGTSTRMG